MGESRRSTSPAALYERLGSDPRRQLVSRILLTEPFQKSSRLPALLSYLTEHSLRGDHEELVEQRIGVGALGKPPGYSPAEDSAVRVHVRQLRIRLHEYFACEGRNEAWTVDLPKGSYELVFEEARPAPQLVPDVAAPSESEPEHRPEPTARPSRVHTALPWIAFAAAVISTLGWIHSARSHHEEAPPWPLSAVILNNAQTKVVLSDSSLMMRLLDDRKFSLDDYLQPDFLAGMTPRRMDEGESHLVRYLSGSQLTSFADSMMVATLVKLAGSRRDNLSISTARGLDRRDFERANLIVVGGPTSNPWVSLFADKLNFEVREQSVGERMYFFNRRPLPGEPQTFEGLKYTGSGGEDYATISLLPNSTGHGNVLLLQGLRQEGTEALGILLADDKGLRSLYKALGVDGTADKPVYFEALIRARSVAGVPLSTSVVATRIIPAN